jgi:hypothetical protein
MVEAPINVIAAARMPAFPKTRLLNVVIYFGEIRGVRKQTGRCSVSRARSDLMHPPSYFFQPSAVLEILTTEYSIDANTKSL